eukprot:1139875-Prorocentrum_minimum.AAC.1
MQGKKKRGKRANLLGAHRSFDVLAVGNRTAIVRGEGRGGGSPGTCCAHGWVTIPQGTRLFFPLVL